MGTATKRPQAIAWEEPVYETTPLGEQVRTGMCTMRQANCRSHKKRTRDFCGVNEHGWIFYCRADADTESHWFVAEPAAGVWS